MIIPLVNLPSPNGNDHSAPPANEQIYRAHSIRLCSIVSLLAEESADFTFERVVKSLGHQRQGRGLREHGHYFKLHLPIEFEAQGLQMLTGARGNFIHQAYAHAPRRQRLGHLVGFHGCDGMGRDVALVLATRGSGPSRGGAL